MNQSDQAGLPGRYAPVNGLQLYFEIHGAGFPLVLIHGGGSTIGTSFGRILPELSRHFQVIAVEMQAHGHTADIDRPLSFTQDADDIAALLEYLNISSAHVFGFSNGASTTLQFAIRHGHLTNKIVVASTFSKKSGAPDWFWPMMQTADFNGMPQPYKDAYLAINPNPADLYRMFQRDVERMQHFPDIADHDLKSIKAKTLIIAGDQDVVRPEHCVELMRLIPQSRLAIFPGGHGDYMGELNTLREGVAPAPSLPVILGFLLES